MSTIKISDLARLPRPQQDRSLRDLVDATKAPPNGELSALDARIAEFERLLNRSSAEMLREVGAGTLAESWEVCQWLLALDRRTRLAERTSRSG